MPLLHGRSFQVAAQDGLARKRENVSLKEQIMNVRTAVAALALAAGTMTSFASFARADITGKVNLDGKPPEMKDIDMAAVKECASQHPDPVQEQTVVADAKGNLA